MLRKKAFWVVFGLALLLLPFTAFMAHQQSLWARIQQRMDDARAAGEPVTWSDVARLYPEVPRDENAGPLYEAAFSRVKKPPADAMRLLDPIESGVFCGPIEDELQTSIKAYLKSQERSLELLHEAAKRPHCRFTTDLTQGLFATYPDIMSALRSSHLLNLQALLCAEKGDDGGATQSIIAALRLGRGCAAFPGAAEAMMGKTIVESSVLTLGALMSRCNLQSRNCELLAEELLACEQMLTTVWLFRERVSAFEWGAALGSFVDPKGAYKKQVVGFFDRMDALRRLERMPFASAWAKAPPPSSGSGLFWCDVRLWLYTKGAHSAHLRAARQALSVEAYRQQHGTLPDKLPEPMLTDPFSGKPLRYQRRQDSYLIYSVGANRRDDGGSRAMAANDGPLDIVFRVIVRQSPEGVDEEKP